MHPYRSAIAIVIAAGLLTAASAQAGVAFQAKDCTGCTRTQIEALFPSCEQGARLVTDFAAGGLYEGCYDIAGVSPRSVPASGALESSPMAQGTKVFHWIQPDAVPQNAFQAYLGVYKNDGHVKAAEAKVHVTDLRPKISLGDDGYMNAYDAVTAGVNNDAVINWLETTTFTTTNVDGAYTFIASPELASSLAKLFNEIKISILNVDFKVNVVVVFHDGSTRTYATDDFGDWVAKPGTARDAHGNPIPENAQGLAGSGIQHYNFNGQPGYDLTNLHKLATLYGVGIVLNPIPDGTVVVCTIDAKQNILCVWPK